MSSGKVVVSGVDTSKLKSLSAEDALTLMKEIKEGSLESRQKFLQGNLKLVLSVTRRFIGKKENIDDIFQIGTIGLMKAVDNFDISYGVKFSTYAVPMIIGEIRRYLRDNTCMRVSRSIRDIAYQALLIRDKIEIENKRDVTAEDIAKELNLNVKEVACALDSTIEPVSIFSNAYNSDNESALISDICRDDKQDGNSVLDEIGLKCALQKLDKREFEIINLRYYQGKTQIEVSEEVGISQAQVSRLEKSALSTISKYM